ncbi:MAG: hypothetical protein IPL55_12135 [Saprospiraceae bacterium]|nr:hypothetical protein [Saprospiraceae bacterium]
MLKHFIFLVFITLMFYSCEKDTVIRYDVSLDAEFDIPSGLNTIETHYFIIRNVPTFYKQSADNRGVDTSSILNVLASKGLIASKFQDLDFDFVERISVYAISQKDPTLKREMYYLDIVPLTTGTQLRMLSSTTELKKILSEELIDIEVRLNLRKFTTTLIRARLSFGYAVI